MLMRNNSLRVLIVLLSALFLTGQRVHAQSSGAEVEKFEVGAQFSILQSSIPREARFTGVVCVTTPCPSFLISNSREIQPGFGGRLGYNLSGNIALEAEMNFFPNADSFSAPENFKGGHKVEGLFGVKAGKRFDKAGMFAKARPGFLYASKGDIQPRPNSPCILIISIFSSSCRIML